MARGKQVVVAGGGALGLSLALALARTGQRVTLCDPAALGGNASGVAAGMLAPAGEAALDALSEAHFSLLLAARDEWPGFAARLDLPLALCGAVIAGSAEFVGQAEARLARLGRVVLSPPPPGLDLSTEAALYTQLDWRLEPLAALQALHQACLAADVEIYSQALIAFEPGRAQLSGGAVIAAEQVVLACGWSPSAAALAPELAYITPIKGQILSLPKAPSLPCILRGEGVYVAPSRHGVIVGATMEAGRDDLVPDPEKTRILRARAAALIPSLSQGEVQVRVGVRAATSDGLPLVGPSEREGVWLATGARRNGWLLAPLIARLLAERMQGQGGGVWDEMLDARRFSARHDAALGAN